MNYSSSNRTAAGNDAASPAGTISKLFYYSRRFIFFSFLPVFVFFVGQIVEAGLCRSGIRPLAVLREFIRKNVLLDYGPASGPIPISLFVMLIEPRLISAGEVITGKIQQGLVVLRPNHGVHDFGHGRPALKASEFVVSTKTQAPTFAGVFLYRLSLRISRDDDTHGDDTHGRRNTRSGDAFFVLRPPRFQALPDDRPVHWRCQQIAIRFSQVTTELIQERRI
jgi:hypothetical protein